MSARFLTTATLVGVLAGLLPAKAADPQLLNLVMPDAKVVAGVNVDQAKTSPMGQYILGQVNAQSNTHLQQITALTGFDPTLHVQEVLVATSANPNEKSGLFLARGNFDPARIAGLVAAKGGRTETYGGATVLSDPKGEIAFSFLSSAIVVAGDMANVKAAIDRQRTTTASLPADVLVRVNQWSSTQDAWAITTVPPTSLAPSAAMPAIPGIGPQQPGQANAFTGIQHAAGGVKFGTNVVVSANVQAATAQDATQLGDTLKLLASLAQLQSNVDPNILALSRSLTVNPNGAALNVSVSLPQDQLVALLKQATTPRKAVAPRMQKKM
jgi:hypothetical protein